MIKIAIGILALSTFIVDIAVAKAGVVSEIRIDSRASQREVCGFKFASVENLVVVGKPIRKEDLRNRVDNERYDACPYNVEIQYKGTSLRVDFSRDVTLQSLRDIGNGESFTTAFFRYSVDGWTAAGSDIIIAPTEITTHEKADSLAVSGLVRRKIENTKKEDFCFSLAVIGEEKYLTGAVCRSTNAELEPLKILFSKQSVIWQEK